MILQSVFQVSFGFFDSKPVVVEPQEGQFTTDAGLLPFRQFDERLGFTQQFVTALSDPRDPAAITHSFTEMVRVRIFGILADYADQNDHDLLRTDPLFKLLAGRSPDDGPLASQPTLSRFENAIDIPSLWRLRDVFIDQFIASFTETPLHLTFDVDTFDDPTHGQQQLTFFHGFYDQYQYLPRVITCAQNDMVVMVSLLFGIAPPFLGFDRDLEYLVNRLRVVWPDVQIELRADSGFASAAGPRFRRWARYCRLRPVGIRGPLRLSAVVVRSYLFLLAFVAGFSPLLAMLGQLVAKEDHRAGAEAWSNRSTRARGPAFACSWATITSPSGTYGPGCAIWRN
jgi:hypothetical protein